MAYLPNVPQPTDNLSDSQNDLLNNFQGANTSFGINHYSFANATADNGKHFVVQTPIIPGGHPTTAANEPKLYAMTTGIIGVLQYSRMGSDRVPTPITLIQSTSAPIGMISGTSIDIIDLAGVTQAILKCYAVDILGLVNTQAALKRSEYDVFYDGVNFNNANINSFTGFIFTGSGTKVVLQNATGTNLGGVIWSVQVVRIIV